MDRRKKKTLKSLQETTIYLRNSSLTQLDTVHKEREFNASFLVNGNLLEERPPT